MHNELNNESLAREIAESLGDAESLSLYRMYTETVSEELLRRALSEALSVPEEKIKKSRGALFTYLVRKYVRRYGNHRP